MAKTDKLKSALARHQGRDFKVERRIKKQKEGEKRSKAKKAAKNELHGEGEEAEEFEDSEDDDVSGGVALNGTTEKKGPKASAENDEDEDEDSEAGDEEMFDLAHLDDTSDSSDEDGAEEEDEEEDSPENEDIALSDLDSLASEEKGDIIPHQRLTINNKPALLSALNRISLPISSLPFSVHQSVTSTEPTEILDIDDDLGRELAFYKQSLAAATQGRAALIKEGVSFSRPVDYFAEMVKSDEHMGKIKQKLIDEAANKKAAAEARKQRDLKKFGKAVQVAKQQERNKEKRETLEKINILKRKRASGPLTAENEPDDLFDVTLDTEVSGSVKRAKSGPGAGDGKGKFKRSSKDQKYGFGGKKRFAKSGDAKSSADMSDYPGKRMKGAGGKTGAAKRPGKARRAGKKF